MTIMGTESWSMKLNNKFAEEVHQNAVEHG